MHGQQPASGQSAPHPDASKVIWSLYYARRGWAVLPLHSIEGGQCTCGDVNCRSPGKHPRTQVGLKDASANTRQINFWWKYWPTANVGIATGAASGLLVFEIDPRNGGDASYEQLRKQFPAAFAQLLEVRTGCGATHLYFECRSPIPSRANILPGIDVKADGDYVVAPPSLDVSGIRYRFASNSGLLLPPLPQALRDLIVPEPQAPGGEETSKVVEAPPVLSVIEAEHLAKGLDEAPQENGEASLSQKQQVPSATPDQDGRTSHNEKPRLLVDNRNPDVTVHGLLEQKFWETFCDLIGLELQLRDDEKSPAATKARVAAIIATETADVWRSRFAGNDCCCSIVASLADALTDPHYVARGVFHHVLANPEGATMPALPVPLDPGFRAAPAAAVASPALGADNKKYLA
jgi:Bifunctional DNA primase/polymerase, N-terminal/CoA-transferase family III